MSNFKKLFIIDKSVDLDNKLISQSYIARYSSNINLNFSITEEIDLLKHLHDNNDILREKYLNFLIK